MKLAGLAFDREGNLWTQSYVDPATKPPGRDLPNRDCIIKIDKAILDAECDSGEPGVLNNSNVP
eukprot:CAMPEP_0119077010 /NCGR_PEP_ID=MMETSP1178-20130426/91692_1 /TAXON_ID=33656 /ORGANISM="unid sp, Strain CCMP2000" /LENGTH=63 /DNA_ID=CAMNT_0007059339 /DNA_START=17 /DNA_END=204 /DNA_ORIENTATION=+